ncbi:MAG: 3-dehydroquinate synthase [Gammaproteobacteria bacterium]|nr:3-dehydroquinate synthase [Gammaproteobacteria bacterium]
MQTLTVQLADRSYPIHIGSGLLRAGDVLRAAIGRRDVLLVSNVTVAPLYAGLAKAALRGNRIVEVTLPDGEQHKTLATAGRVFDVLVANRLGRDVVVLALGGGVIGDLAGFVAACYQRGVDLVQVPTTLLAHVDSSVGGKTAVNHPGGKNLIGAFHQPIAVVSDTELLASLPDRELRSGIAEIIKYGLIRDAGFFAWLERNVEALLARDPAALRHAIYRSCEIKAEIVGRDEREQGERAILNLGHTFGHAIEAATGYVEWLHGEAVATGLLIAADMSRRLGRLTAEDVERVRRLLERAGLPAQAPRIGVDGARGYMQIDKKVRAGRVRLVLLQRIGAAEFTGDYPDAALTATLEAHFA